MRNFVAQFFIRPLDKMTGNPDFTPLMEGKA
jgi:hypothetical protein